MAEKYTCGYCGREYNAPLARAWCEFDCDEKRKQDAEVIKRQELRAKKEAREESVHIAYQNFAELRDQYIRDYLESVAFELGGTKDGAEVTLLLNTLDDLSLLDRLFW